MTAVWGIHAGGPRSPFLNIGVMARQRAGIRDLRLIGEDREALESRPRSGPEVGAPPQDTEHEWLAAAATVATCSKSASLRDSRKRYSASASRSPRSADGASTSATPAVSTDETSSSPSVLTPVGSAVARWEMALVMAKHQVAISSLQGLRRWPAGENKGISAYAMAPRGRRKRPARTPAFTGSTPMRGENRPRAVAHRLTTRRNAAKHAHATAPLYAATTGQERHSRTTHRERPANRGRFSASAPGAHVRPKSYGLPFQHQFARVRMPRRRSGVGRLMHDRR